MELEKSKDQLIRKLDADQAKDVVVDKIDITEDQFRWRLNQDEMATDKLAEGIRKFAKDAEMIKQKLRVHL